MTGNHCHWAACDFMCLLQSGRQSLGLLALSKRESDLQGVSNKHGFWAGGVKGTGRVLWVRAYLAFGASLALAACVTYTCFWNTNLRLQAEVGSNYLAMVSKKNGSVVTIQQHEKNNNPPWLLLQSIFECSGECSVRGGPAAGAVVPHSGPHTFALPSAMTWLPKGQRTPVLSPEDSALSLKSLCSLEELRSQPSQQQCPSWCEWTHRSPSSTACRLGEHQAPLHTGPGPWGVPCGTRCHCLPQRLL